MTISRACVGKRFTRFRHKLPIITRWMQCQFENSKGIYIADFAVCSDRSKGGVIRSAAADNELSNTTCSINGSTWRLRRKPLVNMVMPVQDNVNIIIVESLPNRLGIGIGASTRTIERNMPISQSAEICVRSQISCKPLTLGRTGTASTRGTTI